MSAHRPPTAPRISPDRATGTHGPHGGTHGGTHEKPSNPMKSLQLVRMVRFNAPTHTRAHHHATPHHATHTFSRAYVHAYHAYHAYHLNKNQRVKGISSVPVKRTTAASCVPPAAKPPTNPRIHPHNRPNHAALEATPHG
jgi:hypothetical protein